MWGRGFAGRAEWCALFLLLAEFLLWQTGLTGGLALAATAAVGLTFAVCFLPLARPVGSAPPGRIRTVLRDRALRVAFLPQRDPDAAGSTRPRAPGRPIRTAA
ncbi:DUF6412 domain-containing protein [Streptomyces sp. N2-109]|uniref:DUF6412 domain-containing protein n=1 Tax=Streptomyces gossypii TaxID=2883101 RepID=A0ABT2JTX9_9ACTN|nr:DUF6412 domain-containing protein [Streptomyces gossypii]MCT2591221.1 DUF6412 domain-containing protein [Streptomyces gossypii]